MKKRITMTLNYDFSDLDDIKTMEDFYQIVERTNSIPNDYKINPKKCGINSNDSMRIANLIISNNTFMYDEGTLEKRVYYNISCFDYLLGKPLADETAKSGELLIYF